MTNLRAQRNVSVLTAAAAAAAAAAEN